MIPGPGGPSLDRDVTVTACHMQPGDAGPGPEADRYSLYRHGDWRLHQQRHQLLQQQMHLQQLKLSRY